MASSLGTFDTSGWTRLPIIDRGQDIGWLELASSESSDGTAEPDAPAPERAAMIVAEALTMGPGRSEPAAQVQMVSETPA